MRQQDWTRELRDRMADYEADIPEGLWNDIEQQLSRQRHTDKPLWQRWIGIAAMVAVVIGTGWWLWPESRHQQQENLRQAHVGAPHRQQTPVLPDEVPAMLTASAQAKAVGRALTNETGREAALQAEADTTKAIDQQTTDHTPQQTTKDSTRQHRPTLPYPVGTTRQEHNYMTPQHNSNSNSSGVSIGLLADAGVLATASNLFSIMDSKTYSDKATHPDLPAADDPGHEQTPIPPADTDPGHETSYTTPKPSTNGTLTYEEQQHHDFPLTLGLTVRVPLTGKWTLQTGLVYTRQHSVFTYTTKPQSTHIDQTLHYLGIPLNIQYHIVSSKQWKVYASAGIELDWNLRATYNTDNAATGISKQGKDRPQWSVGAAMGVEYDIIPQLGIYVEPGLRYYPNNGSKVDNYFKDKPACWNLQFGVRVNF